MHMSNSMKNTMMQAESPANVQKNETVTPTLTLYHGNTAILIGLHFSKTSKETLNDKVKKLMRQDVKNGNF